MTTAEELGRWMIDHAAYVADEPRLVLDGETGEWIMENGSPVEFAQAVLSFLGKLACPKCGSGQIWTLGEACRVNGGADVDPWHMDPANDPRAAAEPREDR